MLSDLLSSGVSGSQWAVAYNGSERRWLVDESMTHPGMQYVFRVAAYNAKGWGPFSINSTVFLSPPGVCVFVCVCLCVYVFVCKLVCVWCVCVCTCIHVCVQGVGAGHKVWDVG